MQADMKRVVLVTGHYWNSKRKAGFHWLADAFLQSGWEVLFLTTSLSWLSVPRRDHRLGYGLWQELNQLRQHSPQLWSYVAFTALHPANLRSPLLNKLCTPWFQRYGNQVNLRSCEDWLRQSDLVVFESTAGLMLIDRLQALSPRAQLLYRVSDDLRHLRSHPVVLAKEKKCLSTVDWLSVPSPSMYEFFKICGRAPHLEYHALRKDLFDRPSANPYTMVGPNLVFSGVAYFDYDFLDRASQALPNWQFHILGPIRNLPRYPNIHSYGEMPFLETIPYIQYADIGLQTLTYRSGAESFSHSLKTMQYTYCQLPIVAPSYLTSDFSHWYSYKPGVTSSIVRSLRQALEHRRSDISTAQVSSWYELVNHWCKGLNL